MFTLDEKTEARVASGDLSLLLNRVVQEHVGVFNIVEAATAGFGVGVLANAPKDGEQASVVYDGITMVRVGAAVNYGDAATSAASGWAITGAVTAAKQRCFGTFRSNAASGMLAAVKLEKFYLPNSVA